MKKLSQVKLRNKDALLFNDPLMVLDAWLLFVTILSSIGDEMRIETTTRTLYTFDELPEDIQEKAIEKLWDINVNYEWWESVYEDAETIGLKISEFDLDRASYVKGAFLQSAMDVAKAIIEQHGPHCETVKIAENYMVEYSRLTAEQSQEEADMLCSPIDEWQWDVILNEYSWEIETEDIDDEFLRSLCEDYRIMLQQEYDYLTSEEAIIETIKANEYEFDEEGNLA